MRLGDGKPKRARNLNIGEDQYEVLKALVSLSQDGTPTVSSVVRKAIQEYIDRRLEKDPSLGEQIATLRRRRLIPIRGGRSSERGGNQ